MAGVAVSALLAACSGSASPGAVVGTVTISGGPVATNNRQPPVQPLSGVTVTFTADGQLVGSATTNDVGDFSVSLSPGTYVVSACGAALARTDNLVTVAPDQTTKHNIGCSTP
jgi:hypothetical protein